MYNHDTIILMGEKRIRIFFFALLLLFFSLDFYISLMIHLEEADNTALYAILYSLHGVTIIAYSYVMFGTKQKLIISQFLMGIAVIVIALTLFVVLLFLLLGNKYLTIFICSVIFLFFLALVRWVLIKINYHNFKTSVKLGTSILISVGAGGVGSLFARYIKVQFGEVAELPVVIFCLAAMSTVIGFLGVFGINRYVLAKKAEFDSQIEYLE
jgi:FlaA1/EpsC-like NDP-sugar epimerase